MSSSCVIHTTMLRTKTNLLGRGRIKTFYKHCRLTGSMRIFTTFYQWCDVYILFDSGVSLFESSVSWCRSTLSWLGLSGCLHMGQFWYLLLTLSNCGYSFVHRVVRFGSYQGGGIVVSIWPLVIVYFWCRSNVPSRSDQWCRSITLDMWYLVSSDLSSTATNDPTVTSEIWISPGACSNELYLLIDVHDVALAGTILNIVFLGDNTSTISSGPTN